MSSVFVKNRLRDEYDFDSSDEEDIRNTVGNIPLQWYNDFPHVGYDSSGRPIMRPGSQKGSDAISDFLKSADNGGGEEGVAWRSIIDPTTGQSVVLSVRDLEIVTKISSGKGVLGDKETPIHEPWEDFFSKDVLDMPVTAHPPQKRSFIPSLLDRRRVGRITHAMKMGWIKPRLPPWALDDTEDIDQVRRYGMYLSSGKPGALDENIEEDILGFSSSSIQICVFPDVWGDQEDANMVTENSFAWQAGLPASLQTYRPQRPRPYLRPAAEPLPSHAESYNPPPEFLLSQEEERLVMRAWRDKVKDNQASKIVPLMPRKFDCLRHVPFCERYFREREERIKDMVMATRIEKQQVHTSPEALLPQIPSLSELRPYPSHIGLEYKSHVGRVTSLSISPCGQWLASVSPVDGYLRIWETFTNFCFRNYLLPFKHSPLLTPVAGELLLPQASDSEKSDVADNDDKSETTPAFVAWNPNPEIHMLAVSCGSQIFLINPALGDKVIIERTDKNLQENFRNRKQPEIESDDESQPEAKRHKLETSSTNAEKVSKVNLVWSIVPVSDIIVDESRNKKTSFSVSWGKSIKSTPIVSSTRSKCTEFSRVTISLHQPIIDLSWHPMGDYLLSLSKSVLSSQSRSRAADRLLLHRVSQTVSQAPFLSGSAEEWRAASFHPGGKPHVIIAGPKVIQIFDLVAQKELRRLKLDLPSDLLRCINLHPSGEHIVAGTGDSRFVWFDVELGNVPFKKMKLNHGAVHMVHAHSCRPLVSVALDDGSLFILHCRVSDDLLSKPIIVPVQLIRTGCKNVFSTVFHNKLPHVYAGGEDGIIRQFVAWN